MSDTTKIQWADATFNPWIGCTKVSPGCANCYAENTTRARVLRHQGQETWGKGEQRSRTSAATWRNPVKWNKDRAPISDEFRPRIFPSLCDWLDNEVPIEWLADFLKLIHDTPNLDWLLLTKRPELWRERVNDVNLLDETPGNAGSDFRNWLRDWFEDGKAPQNVWIGTSVEDQKRADERISELLKIPATVRFLSVEPLLGPVDLKIWLDVPRNHRMIGKPPLPGYEKIDWVIVGGESGPKARPCNVVWIRSIVEQCKAARVPVFVKQLGDNPSCECGELDANNWDKKGGNPNQWPEDLRVREFPTPTRVS